MSRFVLDCSVAVVRLLMARQREADTLLKRLKAIKD